MKQIRDIKPIHPTKPDDLFITCSSFEDRCLGVVQYGGEYRCAEAILIRFRPKKPNTMQDRRRAANFDELQRFIEGHSSQSHVIYTERHNPHALGLLAAEQVHSWNKPGLNVTIDISCFTRIQLLFVLRHFFSLPDTEIRLLYSVPTYYGSLENKDLTSDYDRVFVLPFSYGLYERESLLQDRVLIMSLGHDGGRALYAWRYLDPKTTVLVLPRSKHSPELTMVALRKNRELVQHLEMGDTNFSRYDADSHDISSAREMFEGIINQYGREESKTLYFMPGGPKPITVGLALAACRSFTPIYIVYPVPRTYSNAYSVGIEGMLEEQLNTHKLFERMAQGQGLFGAAYVGNYDTPSFEISR